MKIDTSLYCFVRENFIMTWDGFDYYHGCWALKSKSLNLIAFDVGHPSFVVVEALSCIWMCSFFHYFDGESNREIRRWVIDRLKDCLKVDSWDKESLSRTNCKHHWELQKRKTWKSDQRSDRNFQTQVLNLKFWGRERRNKWGRIWHANSNLIEGWAQSSSSFRDFNLRFSRTITCLRSRGIARKRSSIRLRRWPISTSNCK